MKYIFCIALFSCISSSQKKIENPSMFLYLPKSKASLEAKGYKMDVPNFYSKRIQDTLETIHVGNLDSGQFSKSFYVRIRTKDTTSMVDYIANSVDSVLMRLGHVLLIEHEGSLYSVNHGYSGNKTFYVLNFRNPKLYEDKIHMVSEIKALLEYYPNPEDQKKIHHSLELIDKNWKTLPEKTEEKFPAATETNN